jgi:hypothetical protein
MAAPSIPRQSTSSVPFEDQKSSDLHGIHAEKISVHEEPTKNQGDYSGAAAKTDPAEIALVRKLDRRIMVLFHMPQT